MKIFVCLVSDWCSHRLARMCSVLSRRAQLSASEGPFGKCLILPHQLLSCEGPARRPPDPPRIADARHVCSQESFSCMVSFPPSRSALPPPAACLHACRHHHHHPLRAMKKTPQDKRTSTTLSPRRKSLLMKRSRLIGLPFLPSAFRGVSLHISLTFSSTMLQWRSKALTRASSLRLLRVEIRTWVWLRTAVWRSERGPEVNSWVSRRESSYSLGMGVLVGSACYVCIDTWVCDVRELAARLAQEFPVI